MQNMYLMTICWRFRTSFSLETDLLPCEYLSIFKFQCNLRTSHHLCKLQILFFSLFGCGWSMDKLDASSFVSEHNQFRWFKIVHCLIRYRWPFWSVSIIIFIFFIIMNNRFKYIMSFYTVVPRKSSRMCWAKKLLPFRERSR